MISGFQPGSEYKINGRTYTVGHLKGICKHTGFVFSATIQQKIDRSYSTLFVRENGTMQILYTDGTTVEVKRVKRNF